MSHEDDRRPPIPDPTVLVTEAIERAIIALMLALDARFNGERARVEERFARVDLQFRLIEEARQEQKVDTQTKTDAALSAQEKAAAKSEAAMIRSVEQLGERLLTAINSQNTTTTDLKDRVVRIESNKQGGQEVKTGQYALLGALGLVVMVLIAVGTIVIAVASRS